MSYKIPECAKIWEYLLSKDKYEDYANHIDDICARDALSDDEGLTVILPDEKFMSTFKTNIYGDGLASKARKILLNTIIRKQFKDAESFENFNSSIPFRSGLSMSVENVNEKDDIVTFKDNIQIKKDKNFKCPSGFRYSVWEVISGNWPTDTTHTIKKKKRKDKDEIIGGRDNHFTSIGKALRNSEDTKRIQLLNKILDQYKHKIKNNMSKSINPLLVYCTCLYNWLKMYQPAIYKDVIYTTNIDPGVTLLIHLLDPYSIIDKEILFGDKDSNNEILYEGWNGSISGYKDIFTDWTAHLEVATNWATTENRNKYNSELICDRNTLVGRDKMNVNEFMNIAGSKINNFYNKSLESKINKYSNSNSKKYLHDRYIDHFSGRKKWEDQLIYVSTSVFSGHDTYSIDESIQNIIEFRPIGNDDKIYERAATFTNEVNKFMSLEDNYLAVKWLFSTAFFYMPDSVNEKTSLVFKSNPPYNGKFDSPIVFSELINCHRINYTILYLNEKLKYKNIQHRHKMDWIDDKFDKEAYIGGDEFTGGKGLEKKTKNFKKHRLQRFKSDDDDDDDDDDDEDRQFLAGLTGLTFGIPDKLLEDNEGCL